MLRRIARDAKRRLLPIFFPDDYPRINISPRSVEEAVRAHGADAWHTYSYVNYHLRREAPAAMKWVVRNIGKTALIFETGCGSGSNLTWLAQRGFNNLHGADIDSAAIAVAKTLSASLKRSIRFWSDNSLAPTSIPNADVVIAMAWVYLWNVDFSLPVFLEMYRSHVNSGGHIIIDMVDTSFNCMPNNGDRTDDWHLPVGQRRPTQYKLRMSESDVRRIADAAGFDVVEKMPGTEIPPRFVYVLRKRD